MLSSAPSPALASPSPPYSAVQCSSTALRSPTTLPSSTAISTHAPPAPLPLWSAVFADIDSIVQLAENLSQSSTVTTSSVTTDLLSVKIREQEQALAQLHTSLRATELTTETLEPLLAGRAEALSQLELALDELLTHLTNAAEQNQSQNPSYRLRALLERSLSASASASVTQCTRPAAAAPAASSSRPSSAATRSSHARAAKASNTTTSSFEVAHSNLLGTLSTLLGDLVQMRDALDSDPRFSVGDTQAEHTAAVDAVRAHLSQVRSTRAQATKVSELRQSFAELHSAFDELEDAKDERESKKSSLERTRARLERRGGTFSEGQLEELASLEAAIALDRRRMCRHDRQLRLLETDLMSLSADFPEVLQGCFYPGDLCAPSSATAGSLPVDRERSWETDYIEKEEMKASPTGRSGTVWRAIYLTVDEYDDELRQECIVKRYIFNSTADRERFFGELSTLMSLHHPNILSPECTFVNDPATYIHMQFVPRGDMEQWITVERPSSARLRRIFSQVVSTLVYLHQKGIVHRDLKLQNVLVGDGDHPLLIDFDTARNLNDLPTTSATTTMLVATPLYCAPERSARRYPVDVWSFGMMLLMAFFPSAAQQVTAAVNHFMLSTSDYLLNPHDRAEGTLWTLAQTARGQHSVSTATKVLELASLLLRRDPDKRPEVHQLLLHAFFTDIDDLSLSASSSSASSSTSAVASESSSTRSQEARNHEDERAFRVWNRALNAVMANRDCVPVRANRAHLVGKVLGFLEPVVAVPEMRNAMWRVEFTGEAGIDAGGLRTELYTQFFEALRGRCVFAEPRLPSWMLISTGGEEVERQVALPRGSTHVVDGSQSAKLADCVKVGACMARAVFAGVQIPRWLPFSFYLFVKAVGRRDELFANFDPSAECTAPAVEQFAGVLDELDAITTDAHLAQMNEAEAKVCSSLAMLGMTQHYDMTFAGLQYSAGEVAVTDANRFAYIRLRRRHTLYADHLPQLWAMVGGIRLLFQQFELWDVFLGMNPSQMECIFSGPNLVDVKRLLEILDLSALPAGSSLRTLLPEALRLATQPELESFLVKMFAQPRLPLRCTRIPVRPSAQGAMHTHTCPGHWALDLPECPDLQLLRSVLFAPNGSDLAFNNV